MSIILELSYLVALIIVLLISGISYKITVSSLFPYEESSLRFMNKCKSAAVIIVIALVTGFGSKLGWI